MPTTTLATLRQKVAKKTYAARFPITSVATSDSDSRTLINDTLLSPASQIEDYIEAWVMIGDQPAKVDSATNTAEVLDASETGVDVVDGTKFTAGDGIQVESEIMRVVSIAVNTLTVVRGIQSTTAATHVTDLDIYIIGPASGEYSRVTNVSFTVSVSQLIVAPAFSASVVSGQTYELHYKFFPGHLRDKINEILENIRRRIYLPLTLVTDGDMETAGVTNWTAAGTGGTPTLAKSTSVVLHGRQTLSITNNGATTLGYAKSATAYLAPGTKVFVAGDVYITAGDKARLTLYDVTNSTAIETASSVASGWVHLEFTAALPSTCEAVAVWLESQTVSDVTYWGSVQLLPVNRTLYAYPGTLEWSEDFDNVFYFSRGTGLTASGERNSYTIFEGKTEIWSPAEMISDETAVTPYRVALKKGNIDKPLYVGGHVDYATLTNDTDTTTAPEDIVVNLAFADMMDAWAQDDLSVDKIEAANAKMAKAENVRRMLGPRMMHFWKPKGRVHGTMR